jgi:hypothetical protein
VGLDIQSWDVSTPSSRVCPSPAHLSSPRPQAPSQSQNHQTVPSRIHFGPPFVLGVSCATLGLIVVGNSAWHLVESLGVNLGWESIASPGQDFSACSVSAGLSSCKYYCISVETGVILLECRQHLWQLRGNWYRRYSLDHLRRQPHQAEAPT